MCDGSGCSLLYRHRYSAALASNNLKAVGRCCTLLLSTVAAAAAAAAGRRCCRCCPPPLPLPLPTPAAAHLLQVVYEAFEEIMAAAPVPYCA